MNKELLKEVLNEDADDNVPPEANLWPAIYSRVYEAKQPTAQAQRLRVALKPILFGSTLAAILLAFLAFSTLSRPAPVSAEEIVARAAQMVQEEPGTDIRSFHGVYTYRYRNDPNGPFNEERQETWFQAPDKYVQKQTIGYPDGVERIWANGTDGTALYQYVSELKRVELWDLDAFGLRDPNTTTFKVRPFAPTDLASVMDRVRLKIPPPSDPRSAPRPPYAYDVRLVGEKQLLGRTAYVLELALVPGASLQRPDSQIPEKIEMWVDKEIYAVLRLEGWNAQGVVLRSGTYESFEVNANSRVDLLSILAPADTDIIDRRSATDAEVEEGWKAAVQSAPYTVFKLPGSPRGLEPGRPYYDVRRQVISQMYLGEASVQVSTVIDASGGTTPRPVTGPQTRMVELPRLIITQGPPASIKEEGPGSSTPVQIGNLTGRFYSQGGEQTLIFERDGTRIKLYTPRVAGQESEYTSAQLVTIAAALQPLRRK